MYMLQTYLQTCICCKLVDSQDLAARITTSQPGIAASCPSMWQHPEVCITRCVLAMVNSSGAELLIFEQLIGFVHHLHCLL
jgi:hypothetical protein